MARGSRVLAFLPITRRHGQAPDVLGFLEIDSAVSRLVWVNVDDVRCYAFPGVKNKNPDLHANAQCDSSHDQSTMEVDDQGLALTGQGFTHANGLNPNLEADPCAPSGFTVNWLGSHTHLSLVCLRLADTRDSCFGGMYEPEKISRQGQSVHAEGAGG